jgi:hypothetical protein
MPGCELGELDVMLLLAIAFKAISLAPAAKSGQ